MTQTKAQPTKETKPLVRPDKEPEAPLSDEQLETVTGGLLPRGFFTPAILIG